MDGHTDSHSKWIKTDKKIEVFYDIPYRWTLNRNDINELTYKTERDSET